jgi:tRNA nucleotidyltransferase/poly(A) polymerase
MTKKFNIPKDVLLIHKAFKKHGAKLYIVGGAVRDFILDKNPKDFDLATSLKPDETLEIAKKAGFSTAEVGKAFGVVIVGGHEIATFRKDVGKGRRPDSVDYTDIEGDVKRRDLTINALFYDMDRKEIVDLVGGIEDLKNKKIRTVGNASERFDEDPLRKLRALRFQTKLGGKMDTDLLIALKQDPSLKGVSSERIRDEFLKSIKSSKYPSKYMETLDKIGFTKLILPGLKISKPYINDNDEILFLSVLLKKNSPALLGNILNKLSYTNDEKNDIVFLVSLQYFKPEEVDVYKKQQQRTSLSDNQIVDFGKLIGKDMKKFVNFKLSVGGNDVPSDIKGAEIGVWIKNKEKENFLNEERVPIYKKWKETGLLDELTLISENRIAELYESEAKQLLNEGIINEMPMADLQKIDKFADKQLNPVDTVLTGKHFFDRLNDPRNGKEVSNAELIGFFKRLGKEKKDFLSFLNQYNQIVVKDNRTKLNIPFMKQANKLIAKTIMRKDDFKSSDAKYTIESDSTKDSIDKLLEDLDNHIVEMFYPVIKTSEQLINENINESKLLMEGGAYGHMSHPFDTDINLTFGDLKDIVNRALEGTLEFTREKTDGQALAVSWVGGRLVAARNKGHLKNKGAGALDIKGVADKFAGRGELEKAYNFAMKDMSDSIKSLSEKQREKIFKGGSCFMNLEVIYPTSVNVIPYGQPLLVFHGTMEYDESGVAIGENADAGRILAGMIKQINKDVQDNYTIQGPPVISLPKSQELSSKKGKYTSQISKLQKEFSLKDTDGVAEYHQEWWTQWITKNSPSTLDNKTLMGLVKRWAFFDKGFRLDNKNISDEKTLEWAKKTDSQDQSKISKDNLMKFENIFLGVGADVLEFTSSVLTVNPDEAVRSIKKRIDKTIQDVKKSGDPKKIEKLKLELKRLQAIGGPSKIVPNEGIVFQYKGSTFKLTGAFASVNQLLGIFF